jgi:hypothetical protein
MKPEQVALISAIAAVVGGFILRWVLPPSRGVIAGEVSRAEQDYQRALAELEKAKRTPSTDDDEKARRVAELARQALLQKQRLRDALDAFPH